MPFELKEINEGCARPEEFVRACDEAYDAKITKAAEKILKNMDQSPIVLLSGPSGSGKTTTAQKIRDELEKNGVRCHSVSMDNYYKTVTEENTPRLPNGGFDLESPLCLDMDLLNAHFSDLAEGKRIYVPKYEFSRQMRIIEPSLSLRLKKNEIVIFEGIHALNDAITQVHPEAFKLYVSARSTVMKGEKEFFQGTWIRLMRRVVRDHKYRGTGALETIKKWESVRRGERLYINPFKDKADYQFDTAMAYEVSMLKTLEDHVFDDIPKEVEAYEKIVSIRENLKEFRELDVKYLAEDALLHEFIGGGIYER